MPEENDWEPSAITVRDLGDPQMESEIRDRLQTALKEFDGWRVTVLGSQRNDDWETKGANPSKLKSWMVTLMLPELQTAEYVDHIVKERITAEI